MGELLYRIARELQKEKKVNKNIIAHLVFLVICVACIGILFFLKYLFRELKQVLEKHVFTSEIELDKYKIYLPILFIIALAIVLWYLWKPIKKGVSGITESLSKRKIDKWSWSWYIFFAPMAAIGLYIIIASGLWIYGLFQPKQRANWGFTEKQYGAINEQPTIGTEKPVITFPKKKKDNGPERKYEAISFAEEHEAKANTPFYIEHTGIGHVFIPEDEGVWRTITRRNVKYPDEYISFTSKREGNILFVKNFKQSEFRHEGMWEVVVSDDMVFALRSDSDGRVQIVMQ